MLPSTTLADKTTGDHFRAVDARDRLPSGRPDGRPGLADDRGPAGKGVGRGFRGWRAKTPPDPFSRGAARASPGGHPLLGRGADRKSTRLNSSHSQISYAVFCLKKKNDNQYESRLQ